MNEKILIGLGILLVIIIVVVVVIVSKKEKFVLDGNNQISASGKTSVPPQSPLSYLSADTSGNLSASTNLSVSNIDVAGLLTTNGYSGNVGDVLVSNGNANPVWASGVVGLSDFNGAGKQKLSQNGYQVSPGGLITQWGYISQSDWQGVNNPTFKYPIVFPNNMFSFNLTPAYGTQNIAVQAVIADGKGTIQVGKTPMTNSSFNLYSAYAQPVYWTAFGN